MKTLFAMTLAATLALSGASFAGGAAKIAASPATPSAAAPSPCPEMPHHSASYCHKKCAALYSVGGFAYESCLTGCGRK